MAYSWEILLVAVIVIIIFKKVSFISFHFKFLLTYSIVIIVATLLIPYYLLRPKNVLNLLTSAKILRQIMPNAADVKITVRGEENLKKNQSCVVVANHQSSIDVIGLFEIWPSLDLATVLAKREIMMVGTFGLGAWLAGIRFIDRKAGEKAGQAMNDGMKDLKKKNIKLWVFPEGTRRNTGEIHAFKKGAFHAAIQAQVPIVPVVFSSYKHFLDTEKRIFNKGNVIITVLPEIPTEGLSINDVDDLIRRTRSLMIDKYNETSKEVNES